MAKEKKVKKVGTGLDDTLKNIEKLYGKGAVMKMGDGAVKDVAVTSSGSLKLDVALGIGGLPRGRIIEVFGPESSGKTTLALQHLAAVQKEGGTCAFVDAEHAMSKVFAAGCGVNVEELLMSQPDSGEQGLEIVDMLTRSGGVDLIVVDSVAALVPEAELNGDMGDQLPGLQARLMGQALRKLTPVVGRTGTTVVFINQLRHKVGVMFGNPEVTPGGKALKFYSSVRLDVRRREKIEVGDKLVGNKVEVTVAKNKLAPPFESATFDLLFGKGIDQLGEVLDLAVQHELVKKSGAWYSHGEDRIGQGRENAKAFLAESENLYKSLREQVLTKLKS